MNFFDLTIDARGFAAASIGIAVRTIATCPAACHRPDNRVLTGIGLLVVNPLLTGQYHFTSRARCLLKDEKPTDLVDWLEAELPTSGAIVSWPNWGSVPARLAALTNPDRHPHLTAATADTAGRWRALPDGQASHLRQAPAQSMPCLCLPDVPLHECHGDMPLELLPDPNVTAQQLIREATAGWYTWAQDLSAFDDAEHPAQRAVRALDAWHDAQRTAG